MRYAGHLATQGRRFRWHEVNEAYPVDRRPVATVGVVRTREKVDEVEVVV